MENNRKGDLAEIKAVAWLWEQGYEVFRNVGCTGKIDIVAIKDDEVLKIDVKTICWNGESWSKSGGRKGEINGIKHLYYYNNQLSFKIMEFEIPDKNPYGK